MRYLQDLWRELLLVHDEAELIIDGVYIGMHIVRRVITSQGTQLAQAQQCLKHNQDKRLGPFPQSNQNA